MDPWTVFGVSCIVVFFLVLLTQLFFSVEYYEKAKEMSIDEGIKGLFANSVISLYEIKTNGLEADGKYWWHLTWFDSSVALVVSSIFAFGVILLLAILGIAFIALVIYLVAHS